MPGGRLEGNGALEEFRINMHTLLYLKWIINRNLYIAQGTLLNVLRQSGREGSLGENAYMGVYG